MLATPQVVPRLGSRGAPWHGSKTPETGKKKNPYSLGMIKSTDELAAGEQSRSFWLAAPEEGGQPWGE